ncbi:hypothetical protein TRFO_39542 [Tritrichomonas foetus]|uniref:Uncharacterized protein n=1 Tax=Tritrichomonas foetus TaxID=1144522 RepID=A0A1J4J4G2_9EUKA|nr:hypothetical protein TRFO_39542 [Tritrichomonas foetus]|eukprot:OHS94254.1 hypothetical protein TRFO_39542 [Tritrichomonas foetus]
MSEIEPSLKFYQIHDTPRLPDTGAIAVHYWAAADNVDNLNICKKDSGENSLLITDFYGNSPLHYAAACSSYKCADLIVSLFPNQHFNNQDNLTPAHIAAQRGDLSMLKILSKSKYLLTDCTSCNWTPLHFATIYGHLNCVQFILEKCDKSIIHVLTTASDSVLQSYQARDFKFFSALDIAATMKHTEIEQLLVEYHALPSLHSAVMCRNNRALSYFLLSPQSRYKNRLNEPAKYRNCTALHLAAAFDYYEICHSLLISGATLDQLDIDGYSALDVSIICGASKAVSIIASRCNPRQISRAYCIAIDIKDQNAFKEFQDQRYPYDPNYTYDNGDSLLIHAIKRSQKQFAKEIISKGADISRIDKENANALHYAAVSKDPDLCKMLLPLSETKDKYYLTPYAYAIRAGDKDGAMMLSDCRAGHDSLDAFGMTPCLYGLFNPLCVDNSVNLFTQKTVNSLYSPNVKALHEYINTPRTDTERTFFNYATDTTTTVTCPFVDLFGELKSGMEAPHFKFFFERTDGYLRKATVISAAVLFTKNIQHLQKMISKEKRIINHPDEYARTPLIFSALLVRAKTVFLLINNGANISSKDKEGNTLWHYVDDVGVFKQISSSEADIMITRSDINNKGETPFHIACKNGNSEILKKFVTIIDDPAILTLPDNNGNTPLDNSLLSNSNDCIELLHSRGVDNRLIIAINNHATIDECMNLISHGYPVNSSDRVKNTPLHAAVQNQNVDLVNFLISKGADVNANNMNNESPLHVAAILGNLDIIKALLRRKIDLTAFPLESQPFNFSKDPKVKDFLYHYWKRQHYGHKFIDFVIQSQEALMLIDGEIMSLKMNPRVNSTLVEEFKAVVERIIFVSKRIIAMRPTNPKPFNFMTSLHHLLLLLTTIDVQQFTRTVEGTLKPEPDATSFANLHRILVFLFPLRWVKYVCSYIKRIDKHLLPIVDDENIFRFKIKKTILEQAELSVKTIKLFDGNVKSFIPEISGVNSKADTVNCMGAMFIEEVSCAPTCLFFPQFYFGLKNYFSSDFSIPRNIPFMNKTLLRIIVIGKQVIFMSIRDVFALPIQLVHIKPLKVGFQVWTPVGSFKLMPPPKDEPMVMQSMLQIALSFIQEKCVNFNEGESLLCDIHNDTFQCLVVYQLGGKYTVDLRMMYVKANKEEQCFDLVRGHILESIPSNLVLLRVIPRKSQSDNSIIFV